MGQPCAAAGGDRHEEPPPEPARAAGGERLRLQPHQAGPGSRDARAAPGRRHSPAPQGHGALPKSSAGTRLSVLWVSTKGFSTSQDLVEICSWQESVLKFMCF